MFSKELLCLAMHQIWICDMKHGMGTMYNKACQDKVKRHLISGVLALGPRQPEVAAYIACVHIQESTDSLFTSSHVLQQDLETQTKLKHRHGCLHIQACCPTSPAVTPGSSAPVEPWSDFPFATADFPFATARGRAPRLRIGKLRIGNERQAKR